MLPLPELLSVRSSLTILPGKKEFTQRDRRRNLWLLVGFAAMALLVRVAPIHAETVPLSTLVANPSTEITGPGGLIYSDFTYSSPASLPSLPLSDISVTTDSVSGMQSRIQFGVFTAPAGSSRFGTITYHVTPTIGPITDFHLVTPPAVTGVSGRALEDAGYTLTTDLTGVGSTFIGEGQSFPGADHTIFPTPTFPSGLAILAVSNGLQMFGGEGSGPFGSPNAFLTLPHFDNVYTVTVVPEASTWLLLATGLIGLGMRRGDSRSS